MKKSSRFAGLVLALLGAMVLLNNLGKPRVEALHGSVASSRPRHLLCLAMHKDRMPAVIRTQLTQQKLWEIIEI